MKIVPFTEEHLDAAAELLAGRHARHRDDFPELPAEVDYRAEIAALLATGATGAFTDGAYVLGRPDSPERWGPNIWVEAAGHAAADPELLRDVWGEAAARWFEQGVRAHYALVPANDRPLLDAWFRLGFGAQQAHGVIEIPERTWPPGVREATKEDIEELVEIGPFLSRHQRQSPVFSSVPEQTEDAVRADVIDDFSLDGVANLVYEADGRIIGNFFVCPLELSSAHSGLARPPGASFLGFAITHPNARGTGAGVALTDASFAWARRNGYATMVTDWRVTNLLSSRFWPRRGYRTSFLRLHRWIG
ncbi:MAG TPA: GNAT family N-acetyltransferase [Gaiellaceae bacterium]|nr:GNAT family N-acetyltransferase [Gaiellaceae bacterium]